MPLLASTVSGDTATVTSSATYELNVTLIPGSSGDSFDYQVNGVATGAVRTGGASNPATTTRILSLSAGDTLKVVNGGTSADFIGASSTLELIRIA